MLRSTFAVGSRNEFFQHRRELAARWTPLSTRDRYKITSLNDDVLKTGVTALTTAENKTEYFLKLRMNAHT